MEKIFIAADYWTGEDALTYGYPWLVPEAIIELSKILNKNMSVLEFGSGGSTIFFAQRCAVVHSYETDRDWYEKVSYKIKNWKIANVFYDLIGGSGKDTIDDIKYVGEYVGEVDLLYVDSDPMVINRMELINRFKDFVKKGGYLLLDNYNAFGCHDSDKIMEGWSITKWDDLHWWGSGTKLYKRIT